MNRIAHHPKTGNIIPHISTLDIRLPRFFSFYIAHINQIIQAGKHTSGIVTQPLPEDWSPLTAKRRASMLSVYYAVAMHIHQVDSRAFCSLERIATITTLTPKTIRSAIQTLIELRILLRARDNSLSIPTPVHTITTRTLIDTEIYLSIVRESSSVALLLYSHIKITYAYMLTTYSSYDPITAEPHKKPSKALIPLALLRSRTLAAIICVDNTDIAKAIRLLNQHHMLLRCSARYTARVRNTQEKKRDRYACAHILFHNSFDQTNAAISYTKFGDIAATVPIAHLYTTETLNTLREYAFKTTAHTL